MEQKVRANLTGRAEVTAIESIRHEGVKHWTELGIKRKYSGTTKTTFLSTVKHHPVVIPPIIYAIIQIVITAVIWAIIAFVVWTVATVVKEIVAPAEGFPIGLLIIGGVAALYLWKRK